MNATTEEGKSAEEISNVDEDRPVLAVGEHGRTVDADGDDVEKDDDNFYRA